MIQKKTHATSIVLLTLIRTRVPGITCIMVYLPNLSFVLLYKVLLSKLRQDYSLIQ